MSTEDNKTAFYQQHLNADAEMTPYAGATIPLAYKDGAVREHEWVRTRAGLFDISFHGQALLAGKDAEALFSRLTPTDFSSVPLWGCIYTVLTNEAGGIVDVVLITRTGEGHFHLMTSASRAVDVISWIRNHITGDVSLEALPPRSPLISLQGPYAEDVLISALGAHADLREMNFMQGLKTHLMGAKVLVLRAGFTGEDGFKISINGDDTTARHIWLALAQHDGVKPAGIAARDSLRLEAGYPVYGYDITENTTPVEAALDWVLSSGHSGFLGADKILAQLESSPERRRMGIVFSEDFTPPEGAKIFSADGHEVGLVTSTGFSPTTKQYIGQGYVQADSAELGKIILVQTENRRLRGRTHGLSFINPHNIKPGA